MINADVAQLVELLPSKQNVESSNLFVRSNFKEKVMPVSFHSDIPGSLLLIMFIVAAIGAYFL